MRSAYPVLDPAVRAHNKHGSCAMGVMIKAPQPGKVKTRLVPPLTPGEAAALNIRFLRDIATNLASVASTSDADGIAVYTPVGAESVFEGLLPDGFSLLAQRGESFGSRLFHAAEDLLAVGYESLCLIDSDSPTLPRELYVAAVEALARPGDRVVLGEAEDGGYYLIGLKRAHRRLFTDIEWSTSRVFSQTIARASEIGLEVVVLPRWYDIDDAEMLARLCEELLSKRRRNGLVGYAAPHTRDYIAQLVKKKNLRQLWLNASNRG